MVLKRASQLLSTGRWQTLSQWISSLPARESEPAAWLQYWSACAQARTNPALAIKTFKEAQAQFAAQGDRTGRVLSLAGLLHACSVDNVDYPTVDKWLDVLAQELSTRPPSLTAEQETSAWGALLYGAFYVRPWHPCITPGLQRVEELLESIDAVDVALDAATSALTVASQTCQVDRCNRLASRILSASKRDVSPVLTAWGLFQVAHHRFLRADYEGALADFDQVWSIADANGLRRVLTSTLMHRFMLEFRLHDRAAADAGMRRIESLPPSDHPMSQGLLACYQARYAQLRGEPQVAADFAERSQARIQRTGAAFLEMIYSLINGEILLGAGRAEKARPLIERARVVIDRSPILHELRASLVLVESWLAEQEGKGTDSVRLLREALTLSQVGYGWCQMRYVDTTCTHMLGVALQNDIEPAAARRLIRMFRLRPPHPEIDLWPWPVRVHTLGKFDVLANDQGLEFGRKTPKKALTLLKALVAFGPREVSEQQIVDALWPDEEGDAGHKALSVTLLRLRRLLGDSDLVRHQGGKLSINRQKCWVDAWAFERQIAKCSFNGAEDESDTLKQGLALYDGSFLPEDAEESWTAPMRERLRAKFVRALVSFGKTLEANSQHEDAIGWYLKGLDADSIVEQFYQGLMRCYEKLDRRTEAIGAYRRLKQTLSVTLGLQPTASTEKLYQVLRTG